MKVGLLTIVLSCLFLATGSSAAPKRDPSYKIGDNQETKNGFDKRPEIKVDDMSLVERDISLGGDNNVKGNQQIGEVHQSQNSNNTVNSGAGSGNLNQNLYGGPDMSSSESTSEYSTPTLIIDPPEYSSTESSSDTYESDTSSLTMTVPPTLTIIPTPPPPPPPPTTSTVLTTPDDCLTTIYGTETRVECPNTTYFTSSGPKPTLVLPEPGDECITTIYGTETRVECPNTTYFTTSNPAPTGTKGSCRTSTFGTMTISVCPSQVGGAEEPEVTLPVEPIDAESVPIDDFIAIDV
ncbi:uncharacterized protein VTP21DRAFT_8934 [Calcarisporiella thermophila]|uniref:uncharacterized protein n=1 Tax=Calcarisporiella thermophila TaxID=911321 RepID=UPI00374277F2